MSKTKATRIWQRFEREDREVALVPIVLSRPGDAQMLTARGLKQVSCYISVLHRLRSGGFRRRIM
jgi:hypothetical protein